MSKWMENLQHHLANRPVTILHGNVRDAYVDRRGRVFPNLTALLKSMAGDVLPTLREFVSYDVARGERRDQLPPAEVEETPPTDVDDFSATVPAATGLAAAAGPARVLANWNEQLGSGSGLFYVFQYLDKFVCYKQHYTEEEQVLLLWLEKTVENIASGNRLVLVALRDSLVPMELYTHAPKSGLFVMPNPGTLERTAYLRHRLPARHRDEAVVELLAGLTDGLYLRELHPLANEMAELDEVPARRELTRLVNKYRVGEQEDYWGQLSVARLKTAFEFFVEAEGIKGQDAGIGQVIDALCLARAGLSGVSSGTLAKPRGVLFFAGPTGVGKTLVAKKLAKFLFATEEAFLRFDMSEFKEEHTVSRLLGSPPGYVGFEAGGTLTNAIREKPFSVVLFDEIEKAHPKILDIFLQILDDGRLTDSRGQTIYFTETMLIFTSNIGARCTDSRGMPVEEAKRLQSLIQNHAIDSTNRQEQIREHFARAVQRFFAEELSRPELLNRIGNRIVPFNPIDSSQLQRAIVLSHLQRIQAEIQDRYRNLKFRVRFATSVAEWLVESHGSRIAQFGGRGITNLVEDAVLMPLARKLLHAEDRAESSIEFECAFAPDLGRLDISQRSVPS